MANYQVLTALLVVIGAVQVYQYMNNRAPTAQPPPSPVDPVQKVFEELMGQLNSRVVGTIVELELADVIGSDGRSAEELALAVGAKNPTTLFRFLRLAESLGYFKEDAQSHKWSNNDKSDVLRKDHPAAMYYMTKAMLEIDAPAFVHLGDSIVQDIPVFSRVNTAGQGYFDYLAANPEKEDIFARSMVSLNAQDNKAQASGFNWSQYGRVVDVGGNYGSLLHEILVAHPTVQGHVLDLETVVESSRAKWLREYAAFLPRMAWTGGSFFDASTFPTLVDGDVVVLRYILHDWSDEKALDILKAIRTAIGNKRVHLAVIEMNMSNRELLKDQLDLYMHVLYGGKERSREQFEALLTTTGFHLSSTTKTASSADVFVALPV